MELERDIDELWGKNRDLFDKKDRVKDNEIISGDVNKKIEVLVDETN